MATESSDPITAAMIATEREIAGFAWDTEDTDPADPTGDQALEAMGDGLEGQIESDEEEGEEGEEPEVEGEEGGEEQPEAEPEPKPAEPQKPTRAEPAIPPAKLREANEARRKAEEALEAIRAENIRRDAESKAQLDLVMRELAALKAPRTDPAKAAEPAKPQRPDIFENPDGVYDYLEKVVREAVAPITQSAQNSRVETSFAIAHATQKDVFEKAYGALTALNPQNPDDRSTVQRIMSSPNPGEAMISWHKRNQTLAEVGDDPVAYRERVAKETREALAKDPEFRKQLLADLRGEALNGNDGQPRTTNRLPRSLAAARGSNLGADRGDPNGLDGSPQAIADSAWS